MVSQGQVCANTEVQLPLARQPPQLGKWELSPMQVLPLSVSEPAIWRKSRIDSGGIGRIPSLVLRCETEPLLYLCLGN
jgi:hypothetical protein